MGVTLGMPPAMAHPPVAWHRPGHD
jgi:hypothetical protein